MSKEQKQSLVYKLTNIINQKFYIGITKYTLGDRWSKHKHSARHLNTALYRAMRKYGIENFTIETLSLWNTYEEAKKEEIRLIAELRPHYNSTKGGDGCLGYKHTKAVCESISKRMKGVKGYWKGKKLPPHVIEIKRQWCKTRPDKERILAEGPKSQRKRVRCLEDGKIFPSAKEASEFYNIRRRTIAAICRKDLRDSRWIFEYIV